MNESAAALLPADSAGQPAWRVLDTRFDAARLLTLWQAWRAMARPPHVLHLVALAAQAPPAADLLAAGPNGEPTPLAAELAGQWHGLLPGFHRFSLADGRLQLTLCIGALQPLLREQRFEADSVFLDGGLPWDRWSLKALARCCRRGARVAARGLDAALEPALRQAGFLIGAEEGRYDPPWTIRTRQPAPAPVPPADCAVIGAGLAGASVAAALARRGWRVRVLDAAPLPAAGASGLPAGLLVPHVSADDSPRSRLSRAGVHLTRQEARRLLRAGQDWAPCGVLERRLDGSPGLPAGWPGGREDLSHSIAPAPAPWHAGTEAAPELWHPQAAWIKPAQLVRAWLARPGVQFLGSAKVETLRMDQAQWLLLGRNGEVLARASHVVLAHAGDAARLLGTLHASHPDLTPLPVLEEMRGVVSFGLHPAGNGAVLPSFPVNGLGSLIPAVPTEEGLAWYAGATYESAQTPPAPATEHHRVNLDKLRTLLPAAAGALAPDFEPGRARGWGGTRCVSPDRLPLVGPLQDCTRPTLWISAAMGSRGLSFALLCAELLAARLGGEPLPVEASLAAKLDSRRFNT